jgi:hypothetical protein
MLALVGRQDSIYEKKKLKSAPTMFFIIFRKKTYLEISM